MMKKILYTIAAGAMLLAGCSKESDTPATDSSAVKFSTEIATRASGTAWDNGDAIGVFMLTAGGTMPDNIVGNGMPDAADNVKYTTNGTIFTGTPIYYPLSGNVDFVAYYPYRATPNPDPYIYKVDVSNQASPAAIDLLYSNNAVNKAKSKSTVALEFDHKLSRMVLNIKAGEGMTDATLAGVTVKITGMPTKADFSLADGTFSNEAGIATAITPIVATTTSGFVATYTAIIVPQTKDAWSGCKMIFTVGDDAYEYAIPDADDFASGKNYPYAITVSKTGVSVTRGTITDWTGTTDTPGDLGEVEEFPIQMVHIPAGSFIMGSSDGTNIGNGNGSGLNTTPAEPNRNTNETQHSVTLTKDFYMSKYAITFAQYDAYCEVTGNTKPSDSNWGRGDLPVINVTWHDAVAYCGWLSAETGGTWRLPTEAEWEYACRGGQTESLPFGIGDGTKLYSNMANFNGKSPYALPDGRISDYDGSDGYLNTYLAKTSSVGSYASNNYGLYDMHGNVFEWCSDWYSGYSNTAATDPTGPTTGNNRVLRGGGGSDNAQYCRSAFRSLNNPGNRFNDVGFRVVFVP